MFKKILCVIVGVLILVTATLSVNATEMLLNNKDADITQYDRLGIVEKDILTGSVSYRSYSELDVADEPTTPTNAHEEIYNGTNEIPDRSVIGTDGRTKVASTTIKPYSAIAYIEISWPDGKTSLGTAWMIGDNSAATAGHCVYSDIHGGWATNIRIWPGKHGYGFWNNPYGTSDSTRLVVSQAWVNSASEEYDWGLIEFDKDIGVSTGILTYTYVSNLVIKNARVTISGYPGEHRYEQYEMSGLIDDYSEKKLYYKIDTSGGQSGSPILNSDNIAYGIHCYSEEDGYNSGTRITHEVYNWFNTFISECK